PTPTVRRPLRLCTTTAAAAGEPSALEIRRLTWAGVQIASADTTVFVDVVARDIWDGAAPGGYVAPTPVTERRYALVTHVHNDHFDAGSLKTLLGERGYVVCHESVAVHIASRGLKVIPARLYEPVSRAGFTFLAVPAVDGTGDEQVSWVIRHGDVRLFHGGDTMLHGRLAAIGNDYGPFDAAFLPVNGATLRLREDLSARAVMTPEEAAFAATALRAAIAVPIHYGLSDPRYYIEEPNARERFAAALNGSRVAAVALRPGERLGADALQR
ncbi:MAG: MBL fold metallo-hydrolase, partial [Pseudomonadota bacterium]